MPQYKLTYFDARGRAEMIRLTFAAAGVKYEDYRIKPEELQEMKSSGKLPFDVLPVLEIDGEVLPETLAICKYIAREYGLAPTQNLEIAWADAVVDGLFDCFSKLVRMWWEKDEERKKELIKDVFETHIPKTLENLEKILKARGGKHFAGNKLTYADIIFFSIVELFQMAKNSSHDKQPILTDKYAALKDLNDTVASNPGIKKWLSERPQTTN